MFIDIIAFVLLIMGIFKGLRKGLIIALFSFLGFIAGLAAALKLSAIAAGYIGTNMNIARKWLPVLAFTGVFIAVFLLIKLGAKMLEKFADLAMLGWLNKL
ncbi:MAG TPA: CvpA family protein, partial [Flavisolibacter sp.]|nr:CvpA family protein [Flavisolibacter sp.]